MREKINSLGKLLATIVLLSLIILLLNKSVTVYYVVVVSTIFYSFLEMLVLLIYKEGKIYGASLEGISLYLMVFFWAFVMIVGVFLLLYIDPKRLL